MERENEIQASSAPGLWEPTTGAYGPLKSPMAATWILSGLPAAAVICGKINIRLSVHMIRLQIHFLMI